jgi:hypothetical protein
VLQLPSDDGHSCALGGGGSSQLTPMGGGMSDSILSITRGEARGVCWGGLLVVRSLLSLVLSTGGLKGPGSWMGAGERLVELYLYRVVACHAFRLQTTDTGDWLTGVLGG